MTTNLHDISLRVLAGFLSAIMTLLMFLPMKAAFGQASPDVSGHYSGSMDITSELGETRTHPAVAVFQQSGRALSGTIGFSMERQAPIQNGRIHGTSISFSVMLDGGVPLEFRLESHAENIQGSAHAKAQLGSIHAKLSLSRDT